MNTDTSPAVQLRLYFSGMCNGAFLFSILLHAAKPAGTLQFTIPIMVFFVGLLLNPSFKTWRKLCAFSIFFGVLLLIFEPVCALAMKVSPSDFFETRIGGVCFVLVGLHFAVLSRREQRRPG